MAYHWCGGDGGEDRAMRQARNMQAKVSDLLAGERAPESGTIRFVPHVVSSKRYKGNAMPGDTVRTAFKGDVPTPCSGKV